MNINGTALPRTSGILLHPTSLPSPYGIGDLGRGAYEFADFLAQSGQHLWQVLPLTHTGFGDSPYQSFSAFAGQPLLINPEHLMGLSLLEQADLDSCPGNNPAQVDYGTVIPWKTALFRKAYEAFQRGQAAFLTDEFQQFCREQAPWLNDYALFMALKDHHQSRCWLEWPEEYRITTPDRRAGLFDAFRREASFYQFIQFLFFKEWRDLKRYANDRGIRIIGDIPIFVSMDSAEVWAYPHLFQLDPNGFPSAVAGVPPDYFSSTGQLWGNPLYNWEAHKQEGYRWWIARVQHQLQNLDILRIDHFRGFEAYWAIPYGESTAVNGRWMQAPGRELFGAIQNALGEHLPIIAEDLGIITPEVEALRDAFAFPGMNVLQFAFEDTGESSFLPHHYTTPNCVCYTGTHDNDTTRGWYETLREDCRQKLRRYLHASDTDSISWQLIRLCLSSTAAYAIFPLQDVLDLGSDSRMNLPGRASGNWSFRFRDGLLTRELADALREMSRLYGRY